MAFSGRSYHQNISLFNLVSNPALYFQGNLFKAEKIKDWSLGFQNFDLRHRLGNLLVGLGVGWRAKGCISQKQYTLLVLCLQFSGHPIYWGISKSNFNSQIWFLRLSWWFRGILYKHLCVDFVDLTEYFTKKNWYWGSRLFWLFWVWVLICKVLSSESESEMSFYFGSELFGVIMVTKQNWRLSYGFLKKEDNDERNEVLKMKNIKRWRWTGSWTNQDEMKQLFICFLIL